MEMECGPKMERTMRRKTFVIQVLKDICCWPCQYSTILHSKSEGTPGLQSDGFVCLLQLLAVACGPGETNTA